MSGEMHELTEWLGLKNAQKDAVEVRGADVLVAAGAGSGKTRTLVARYMTLLHEGLLPRQIVAITFTDKAAREMRNRIRATVHGWRTGPCTPSERERWDEIEADIDTARIGTIHSLCASLLRAHPAEAMIDPMASVLEEGLSTVLKAQAIEDTLTWVIGQAEFKLLLETFKLDELRGVLTNLLVNRLEARGALQPNVSERWQRAISKAIESFVDSPDVAESISIMRELRDSSQLDADAGDKLAAQVRGLLSQWDIVELALKSGDHIAAAQALHLARKDYSALNVGKQTSRAKAALKALRGQYDSSVEPWLGKSSEPPPDLEVERKAAESVGLLGELFEKAADAYRLGKDLRQAVDFDDLEEGAERLLENPAIRARWQGQIAALLVDEFQDTNERQRRIVEALAGIPEGKMGRLFVVGDAKQSIYRFRGADVAVFQNLHLAICNRGGRAIPLNVTFRAHKPLVEALNDLLGAAMGNGQEAGSPFAVPFSPLEPDRPQPRPGIDEPYVEFLYGVGESADAARPVAASMLARRLIELHDRQAVQWEDIALLFRAAAGFPVYEAALEEAGIPFITVAGKGFYDRPEVRDLLNILAALADPWDDLAMAGLLRSPAFGLSNAALYQLRWPAGAGNAMPSSFRISLQGDLSQLSETDRQRAERARMILDHLTNLADRVTVAELIKELIDKTLYRAILGATGNGMRLQRNLDKLLADASASGLVRVAEFLEYVGSLREGGAREGEAPAEAGGAVRLMSVHRAKGLEFTVVVIADASRSRPPASGPALLSKSLGLVPCPARFGRKPLVYGLARALDEAQDESEDLRVLYVAATRAKEKLLICGHQSTRQSRSWLVALAAAADLNLAELAGKPGELQMIVLPRSGQRVSAISQLTPVDLAKSVDAASPIVPEPVGRHTSLLAPVACPRIAEPAEEDETIVYQILRITGRRFAEGAVVGNLVHEAIRRWRFPGDPTLDRVLRTAAVSSGLVDPADIAEHICEAELLLARFRADPRWPDLDAAQRWHEVPYSVLREGKPSTGFIDLLYWPSQATSATWCIVDFKTDRVTAEPELGSLIERYSRQILRYRQSISPLLRGSVHTTLCFLDYCNSVRWENVR